MPVSNARRYAFKPSLIPSLTIIGLDFARNPAALICQFIRGVMYVLDEPSIGLHQRDNQRLLETLTRLRDIGNTVIVVEHDEDAIRLADYVVDIGPGAGVHGGEINAKGPDRGLGRFGDRRGLVG